MAEFGTIAGAVSLALAIKAFCDSLTLDAGNDRLIVQIQHDAAILQSFAEVFDKVTTKRDLEDQEKLRLNEICAALKPLLEQLGGWIETKKRMRGEGVNKAAKWADKIASLLWRNADTRRLAAELMDWTERYHIRLSLLPIGLREKLLRDVTDARGSVERSETHLVVRDLRASFQDMSLMGPKDDGLILSEALLMADASHTRLFGSYDKQRVVVEYKTYPGVLKGAGLDQLSTAVGRLAATLHHSDTHLCRILKCLGYIHQAKQDRYALIYEIPFEADLGQKPPTLLDLIKTRKPGTSDLLSPQHPLNQRFELARKIVCAVLYVQAMGFVHKSIRTSNVIVLERRDPLDSTTDTVSQFPKSLGNPYLCGFDAARQDKAASDQAGDAYWDLNVYRHPARQGLHPEERYSMNHDIYSLGVVLLELGIWKPLLALSGLKALKSTGSRAPSLVKQSFVKLAKEALPVIMGQKYCDLVAFCLEIDGENPVTASTAVDEVLSKLEEMSAGLH